MKKVDDIIAPEEVYGTKNTSYEKALGIILAVFMVVAIIAICL